MRLIRAIGHFAGPLLAGIIYDMTDSYVIALTIFAVCVFIGALCMFLAKRPSPPRELIEHIISET